MYLDFALFIISKNIYDTLFFYTAVNLHTFISAQLVKNNSMGMIKTPVYISEK